MEDHRKGDKYKETVEGTELSISTSTDLVTQTDVSYKTDVERGTDDQLKRLDYLMGSYFSSIRCRYMNYSQY